MTDTAWVHIAGPFEVWNHRFAIQADSEELGRYLGELWAACRADVEPVTTYGLDREHRLYVDDELLPTSRKPSIALRDLVRRVNADVIAAAGDLVVVHAAGAARDGKGVLFPAAQEAGKTTLVAGLVRAGWDYLSDEAVAIHPETLELLPYPKPMSVDPGSWDVLADLKPNLPAALQPYLADQWQLPPFGIYPDYVSGPVPAAAIIGPAYKAGAATTLEPLTKAEGLMLLADSCFTLHRGHRRALAVLAAVAGRSRGYKLVMTDLPSACILAGSALVPSMPDPDS